MSRLRRRAQYLAARLIDEMQISIVPELLGSGEPMFAGLDLAALGYQVNGYRPGRAACHMSFARVD